MNNRLEHNAEAYALLGLKKEPSKWENALRTAPRRNSFESWNIISGFEDGSFLSAEFCTRKLSTPLPLSNPTVTVDLILSDGTAVHRSFSEGFGKSINASSEICDINVSGSYLKQTGNEFIFYYVDEVLEITAEISNCLGMWRPGTGRMALNEPKAYLNWLVCAPRAEITAEIRYGGRTVQSTGTAYIDHIWSGCDIRKYIDHRYLCFGHADDFTAIGTDIVLRPEVGGGRITVMYAAKNGILVFDGSGECMAERSDTFIHPATHRFFDGKLFFSGNTEDGEKLGVQFEYNSDIYSQSLPKPFNTVLNIFGRKNTILVSKCDLIFSGMSDLSDGMRGSGFMQQYAYSDFPQAEPNELLGTEWPSEAEDSETKDAITESSATEDTAESSQT